VPVMLHLIHSDRSFAAHTCFCACHAASDSQQKELCRPTLAFVPVTLHLIHSNRSFAGSHLVLCMSHCSSFTATGALQAHTCFCACHAAPHSQQQELCRPTLGFVPVTLQLIHSDRSFAGPHLLLCLSRCTSFTATGALQAHTWFCACHTAAHSQRQELCRPTLAFVPVTLHLIHSNRSFAGPHLLLCLSRCTSFTATGALQAHTWFCACHTAADTQRQELEKPMTGGLYDRVLVGGNVYLCDLLCNTQYAQICLTFAQNQHPFCL